MYCLKFKVPTGLALLFILLNCDALKMESAKEQSCLEIKKTANVDFESMSVKEWYYPLMSRLDLYRTSLDTYGNADDFSKLRESQVYYDGCFIITVEETNTFVTGFHGKQSVFKFDPLIVTDEGISYRKFKAESGMSAVIYSTLTDNATYTFSVICWDDNQASWGVASTVPSLPKDTVKLIYKHAESLGFKNEYFEELRYDYCGDEQKSTKNHKAYAN